VPLVVLVIAILAWRSRDQLRTASP